MVFVVVYWLLFVDRCSCFRLLLSVCCLHVVASGFVACRFLVAPCFVCSFGLLLRVDRCVLLVVIV